MNQQTEYKERLEVRRKAHAKFSRSLAQRTDREIVNLLSKAEPLSKGLNSDLLKLTVDGTSIFIKKMKITDLELQQANFRSTANLFELPSYYHYGIGSAGFGVWRELFCHEQTTQWVLSSECVNFPLLYHWRILPNFLRRVPTDEAELAMNKDIEYWGGSPAIRNRLEALNAASNDVILFLEYIPTTLADWFKTCHENGWTSEDIERLAKLEEELLSTVSFMNAKGTNHFDAHSRNILIDANTVYFTDFGLATSERFDLSQSESEFLKDHKFYDLGEVLVGFCIDIFAGFLGTQGWPGDALIRKYAAGLGNKQFAAVATSILSRYAELAVLMNRFYMNLQKDATKQIRFPETEITSFIEPIQKK